MARIVKTAAPCEQSEDSYQLFDFAEPVPCDHFTNVTIAPMSLYILWCQKNFLRIRLQGGGGEANPFTEGFRKKVFYTFPIKQSLNNH